jgi:electron transfer flavoprotein alpha subunit
MGAEFGASRPVVMNAWAPRERLIGVSGTRTAPLLCIVVGASGAPALHWGIEKAAFIVAINPDQAAPIVAGSDAAVLDDGVAVVEELAEIIAARRKRD